MMMQNYFAGRFILCYRAVLIMPKVATPDAPRVSIVRLGIVPHNFTVPELMSVLHVLNQVISVILKIDELSKF